MLFPRPIRLLAGALLLLLPSLLPAQTLEQEGGLLLQGVMSADTPFWLQSNRYDRVPQRAGATLGGLYRGRYEMQGGWRLDWGTELHARTDNGPGQSWVNQAWAGLSWNLLSLRVGQWQQTVGMAPAGLSAGPSIWSAESRPMPKIKAELTDFWNLPLTGGWLSIRGGMAHGWFDGGRQVLDFYLHEKYLYGKLGRQGGPELYAGLLHMAQWGGFDTFRYGQLPEGWDAFWRIFLGREGGEDAPDQFQTNQLDNSLGSWQAGLMWRTDRWEIRLNKETIFEDGSGFKLRSPEDGVQGIHLLYRHDAGSGNPTRGAAGAPASGLTRFGFGGPGGASPQAVPAARGPQPVTTQLTWEFWHTKSQSGPGLADPPPGWEGDLDPDGHRFGGRDDYFNHGVYHEGWSYRDRLIGVPLITYSPDRRRVVNNRLIAHHLSLQHRRPWSTLQLSATWSRNYGRYEEPVDPPREQLYLLLAWERSLEPLIDRPASLRLDLGLDAGEFSGNRAGLLVSLLWRFL